jgi:FAD:protein FMN transferase
MAFNAKIRRYLVAFLIAGWSLTLIYSFLRFPSKYLPQANRLYRDNRVLMGTFWEVTSPNKQAATIVFSEAGRIEQLLSKYLPSSEVSRLNLSGKLKVSPDTFYIIKKSLEFCALTQGAFDITVGPLVDLWGFTDRKFQVPEAAKIRQTLELVGYDKIILHENNNVVEFRLPGVKIDLGGIAKGYALDCAVRKLKAKHIYSCLINAGGQVYCLGDRFGQSWKIGIQGPRKPEIAGTLELKNKSASTSGDYQQYFEAGGKRYCHIIDPRTGSPAESGITSVTVIADSGLEADALSTAVFVLGKQKAKVLSAGRSNLEIKITE